MKCGSCGSKTKVLETRNNLRRRECTACGKQFWTEEILTEARPDYRKGQRINWHNPFGIASS